ncbi:histone acetyltransferase type B catalytic subunit [Striga asiatica]|uniref:histone acetyltransferase n=1 Tax=Striga asiatica TaxID=4170 RepID=A0A5A7NXA8_STRAF|nr:histone acetyltransferase type B catalytic subunit [Striga asiatica]
MGTKHHHSSDPTADSKRRRCSAFSKIDAGIEPKECIKVYLGTLCCCLISYIFLSTLFIYFFFTVFACSFHYSLETSHVMDNHVETSRYEILYVQVDMPYLGNVFLSGKDEVDSPNSFQVEPIDLNPFFEEDGKIYGYQGLKITVWLSSISFHAYADISFESTSDGGKGITDLKSSLQNIFAENLVESKDDFLQTFSSECHYVKYRKGYGICLLKTLNSIAIADDVYDVTMEEPVESLQHVRTCIDVQRLLAFDPIHEALDSVVSRLKHENLSKKSQPCSKWGPPAKSVIEDVRKNLKINKRQFLQCWEILIYLGLDDCIEKYMENYKAVILFRMKVDVVGKESGGKRLVDIPTEFDGDMSFAMFKCHEDGECAVAIEKDEGNQEEQLKQLVDERMKEIKSVAEKAYPSGRASCAYGGTETAHKSRDLQIRLIEMLFNINDAIDSRVVD